VWVLLCVAPCQLLLLFVFPGLAPFLDSCAQQLLSASRASSPPQPCLTAAFVRPFMHACRQRGHLVVDGA
jgi:hypothetical protein